MRRAFILLVISVAATACVEEPDVGTPLRAVCDGTDSDPSRAVSYATDIDAAIFHGGPHCVRCHTPGFGTPIGVTLGGLDISSLEQLRHGGVQSGESLIMPGDPCGSVLVQKIGASPPFGARMPLDGPPYVDPAKVQIIKDWIAEGAHAN